MAGPDANTASKPQVKADAIASVLPEGFTLALDRTRAFAEVHGEHADNVGFIQDRIPFDKAGRFMQQMFLPQNAEKLKVEHAGAADSLKRKIERHLAEQKAATETKLDDTSNQLGEQQPHDTDPDADVNLVAWAKGDLKLLPHVVYRVAQKRFGKHFRTFTEVAAHMVEKKAIAVEDVAVK